MASFSDSDCAPVPENQWYIDVGSISLRNGTDSLYNLSYLPPFDNALLFTAPTGQTVSVEPGTGDRAGLSRITIQSGSDSRCLSWGSLEEEGEQEGVTITWQPCRDTDEYLASLSFASDFRCLAD